jgi:ATP-dependent protease Clp ATPase subunit
MWWRKRPIQTQRKPVVRCSFCNHWQHDVDELIAGPGVFICDECVEVCNDVLAEAKRRLTSAEARPRSEEPITWPNSIECALCHAAIRMDDGVVVADNRGTLCLDCVNSIASQHALDRD